MKKLFNLFAMLLSMTMVTTFTACEPEAKIDEDEKTLAFLCGQTPIASGSTFTSSTLDSTYLEMGMTRFVPGIDLVGDSDGKVIVIVESLSKVLVEVCAFGGCQITLPYLDYTIEASGEISANSPLPLDIHYTPSEEGAHRAVALVTAYYEGRENEAISFTLVMTNHKVE